MQHPNLLPTPVRYTVKLEGDYILSTMKLSSAIEYAYEKLTKFREDRDMHNFNFYIEVHIYLEQFAINN